MARLRDPEGGCPWDLEQTYGLTEGNIFHGELPGAARVLPPDPGLGALPDAAVGSVPVWLGHPPGRRRDGRPGSQRRAGDLRRPEARLNGPPLDETEAKKNRARRSPSPLKSKTLREIITEIVDKSSAFSSFHAFSQ